MYSYTQICSFKTDFPIRTLELSFENDYLLALSKDSGNQELKLQKAAFWILEKNEGAFRINVPLKGITGCYVTPDSEFMVSMTKNEQVTLWNIKSRTMITTFQTNTSYWLQTRPINGTKDSKYIFFQKEKGEVSQWECATQKYINTYIHNDLILDIAVTSDDKFLYCMSERYLTKWEIETH